MKIRYILPFGFEDSKFLNSSKDILWEERIADVINCPDNKHIKRNSDAGRVKGGKQIMHNGIYVTLGGYYGEPITKMLYKNYGVHEPQEEYVFQEVLKILPEGSTMIELGAYWSFYSIWFHKTIKNAKNFLVEPDKFNLVYGKNNFRINNAKGKFTHAYVGKDSGNYDQTPIICVDDFVAVNNISQIDILHSDIQGFEYDMLLGASKTINENRIRYIFISTHGNKVHYECLLFLEVNKFEILCSIDENDTYSMDGLIVARSKAYEGIDKINVSLKSKVNETF
jgi:hypothetical protein